MLRTTPMNTESPTSASRRDFLKTAAAAITAPYFVPATVLGAAGQPPPSGRIRLGLIGCGGMGRANLNNCAEYPDVVVTGRLRSLEEPARCGRRPVQGRAAGPMPITAKCCNSPISTR